MQALSNHSIFRETVYINRSWIFIALPKLCARHLGVNITGSYSCASGSAADPDPNPDPYVFGPPGYGSGSGSISQRNGSESFYYQAKIVRKTLIPTVL
jgi:hypothetical protein